MVYSTCSSHSRKKVQHQQLEAKGIMAYAVMKPAKPSFEEPQEQINRIRITLSSMHVKNLEKGVVFAYLVVLR
ncbi:hypothetical protein JRO89_XS13G0212300 [Xanthoceras sorbifolium]|uniref:Uncharacterized protein n=1 Tax=Xanthoceras sorbifolium TaxID=99658 RepID=A0ABQ8H9D9_9ROSI|nr:hypothetical protein JRO89_XS13G0212300 [Xanthoceras sorbifolium]